MLKIILLFLLAITITSQQLVVVSTTQNPTQQQQISPLERELAEINHKLTILNRKVEKDENVTETQSKSATENCLRVQTAENKISSKSIPTDCQEVQRRGNTISGIYRIQPHLAKESFLVLCDMKTKGGGWSYVLNRFDGSQNFYLNWSDYKNGFGNLAGEFWLGLENLYLLTGYEPNELLFELVDWDSKKAYARFGTFAIGDVTEGYYIKLLKGYSGDAGDSFSTYAGMKFSTNDNDQDNSAVTNCVLYFVGAWWYNRCSDSDLSGQYKKGVVNTTKESIMFWNKFRGNKYSLKQARMMVKPRDNTSPPLLPHEIP